MSQETGPWMPMYWGDYLADTTHLTTFQHGIYILLIAAYWRRGKGLPDDDKYLRSLTKTQTAPRLAVREILSGLFYLHDGLWKHKRLEYEILRSSERLQSARANGRAGGLAKSKLVTPTPTITEESKAPLSPPNGGAVIPMKGNGNGRRRQGYSNRDSFQKAVEYIEAREQTGGAESSPDDIKLLP